MLQGKPPERPRRPYRAGKYVMASGLCLFPLGAASWVALGSVKVFAFAAAVGLCLLLVGAVIAGDTSR